MLAIGHTRLALETDGLDIRARPEFIQVQKNGADLNAVSGRVFLCLLWAVRCCVL